MLAFEILQSFVNFLGFLLLILVQGMVFAFAYLLIFVGGTGLGKGAKARRPSSGGPLARWLGRYREGERDREVRFCDIVGLEEAKQELEQLVDVLKRPESYRVVGAEPPRGVLLVGPPGTGKTMIARAIANEAGVPFYSLAAADFANMFLGVGSQRIRQIYRTARRHPRAIVFIDEIEVLAKARGTGLGTFEGDSNTLNAFLNELDGFAINPGVITIGATNLEDQVDAAVMRPGRLDWQIYIGPPAEADREKLFRFYLERTCNTADPAAAAKLAVNFTPAEIRRAVNEAGLLAVRGGRVEIAESDLTTAVDKVSATLERRSGTFIIGRSGDLAVRLAEVIGCEEAKGEVQEFIDFLRSPDRYRRIGAKVPRGFLFVGPPGTGKTLLAKAIANEAGVPFYALSGSDFTEVWVGLGASRVRQVYRQARKHKAAIVFIDEIDALAARRGLDSSGEADRTLNQFLVELDGFGRSNVLTIGATNRLDTLDPALLRPGRLDRTVAVPLPDLDARERLFEHYLARVQAVVGINCRQLARASWNMSGAEVAASVNEASFIAVRDGRGQVTQFDLNQGIERVLFGLNSRRKVNAEDRRLAALHEAGHAVVEYHARPRRILHKLTISPDLEGTAGYSWSIQDEEQLSFETREGIRAEIQVLFGGRVAEELFYGTVTTGAGADLARAAHLAHRYVWQLGMGEEFLADYAQMAAAAAGGRVISERTKERLDLAVEKLLREAKSEARTILEAHRDEHERLTAALLERESLYGEDILRVLRGETIEPSGRAACKDDGGDG
ncbi:AAA family ATPase [Gloeobacter violaceus]|uniref:Glr2649 protein n=1 Tax=Gloeobacter violaceus (strain ATCC 29082 / PCC 7421) TaxID=251221 RepID=Q7NH88_GLOVI|nr:AAA family ATPase [Gloeobacter violaceus]BAC90590.1 glr2649 [Gloeobacter violaceus PCC 7421]